MKIVVTTDGSLRSLSVVPHISSFAAAAGSEIFLLRVLDPAHDIERRRGVPAHRMAQPVIEQELKDLQTVLDGFLLQGEPRVTVLQKRERTHDAILREAEETGAGMIALSSRGSGAFRHALLGSVAMGVVGCSALPVFTAGPNIGKASRRRGYRLLATTDGSPASRQVLDSLSRFLTPAVSLALLRVYVPTLADKGDRAELADCRAQVKDLRASVPPQVATRSVVTPLRGLQPLEDAIVSEAERLRADVIAMSTHGHSARHHLLAGSTALGVLANSPLPVILARSEPAADCR